ncbi:hypothetical protein BCY88_01500 [Paraburkholderia fungorum]|uniref:Uncharacterized protein n=1 Tax=Paraburkholderia fungorum TaxID=134537 RepID=A0A420H040_9BURK|nr:hypothetical protein BCY88_01500 [Paraburkholderia fungorum]
MIVRIVFQLGSKNAVDGMNESEHPMQLLRRSIFFGNNFVTVSTLKGRSNFIASAINQGKNISAYQVSIFRGYINLLIDDEPRDLLSRVLALHPRFSIVNHEAAQRN